MADLLTVRRDVRYVVTDEGRNDLLRAETCPCNQLFVCDGVYSCQPCGTIYGVVFGFSVTPRKLQSRVHR